MSTNSAVRVRPGDVVRWERGGGWSAWPDGEVERVTDNGTVLVVWRRYDSKTHRWVAIRRHCRPDQLEPVSEG